MTTPLAEKLKKRIKETGPISVDTYMQACLYDEDYGYYTTRNPFEKSTLWGTGDFITAPELTPLFGQILGAWVIDTWQKLGSPSTWHLLEAGPGQGTLMKDILSAITQLAPHMLNGMTLTLIEISPHLKRIQRKTLSDFQVTWQNTIQEADFSTPTIVIANELLDAFPIKQFIQQGNSYQERLIEVKDDGFTFTICPEKINIPSANGALITETSPAMESFLCTLKDKLKNGAALFIDYGAESGETDTLQAMRAHQFEDIFRHPGEADLTSHVRFGTLREILGHTQTTRAIPMGTFLCNLGLPTYAAKKLQTCSESDAEAIESAMHRLLHPEQMGGLFKAICYTTTDWTPAGF